MFFLVHCWLEGSICVSASAFCTMDRWAGVLPTFCRLWVYMKMVWDDARVPQTRRWCFLDRDWLVRRFLGLLANRPVAQVAPFRASHRFTSILEFW